MMKKILLPMLLIMVLAFGRNAVPSQSVRAAEIKIHNINQVEMCISNFGKFGQTTNGDAGLWWPKGSGDNYVYGAGPWFGTLDGADTLVTIGYGPHGGETEYVPGLKGMSQSDPDAIIFMDPSPWPPPLGKYEMAPQVSKSHQDSWCAYNDFDESAHIPGDTRPIGLEVYQTVYAWNLTSTQDIIFVKYEMVNLSEDTLRDCFFGVATDNDIGNEAGTGNDIISGIVGDTFIVDNGTDTIWVDNLGYQWQEDPEPGWSEFPGTIGFDYLQSPWDLVEGADKDNDTIPDQYERDSSYYVNNWPEYKWDIDLDGTMDWRDPSEIPQLGMSAFKRFTLNLEPNKDNERYVTLAGYNFKTLVYEPYDTVPPDPDDQRFLQCSGPFEMAPEDTAVVLVGIMLARWYGITVRPDTSLVKIDATAQFIYDKNWLLPGPPKPPNLTLLPGDKNITLIWDNLSEVTGDPYWDIVGDTTSTLYDPFYVQYDFEGYGIWKSMTGNTGDWELLERCDKFNGIIFEDTTEPESIRIKAIDNGIYHSYLDTDVRNGFTYHYAITAFDYNWVKDIDTSGNVYGRPLWFESGMVGVTVVPRRDPANYVPPEKPQYEVIYGNEKLTDYLDVVYADPLGVSQDKPLFIEFGEVTWDSVIWEIKLNVSPPPQYDTVWDYIPVYMIRLLNETDSLVDSVSIGITLRDTVAGKPPVPIDYSLTNGFSPRNGMSVVIEVPRNDMPYPEEGFSIFEKVEILSGSYPISLLTPMDIFYNKNYGRWAYRGNEYEVTWTTPKGPLVVVDVFSGDTVPFKHFYNADSSSGPSGWSKDSADCWCFMSRSAQTPKYATDTLILTGPPAQNRTKWLYLCGGWIRLAGGGPMSDTLLPGAGDTWRVKPNQAYTPAPVNAKIKIIPDTPGYFSSEKQELNVKVVPNPYIVHNEWQQSTAQRRLRFINLPSKCTVRIFNINGELVKTLVHRATVTNEDGSSVTNNAGGDEWWDLLSENRQLVASGIYIFHVQSDVGDQISKFVVIR
jgi:hypothetical protein